MNAGVNSSDLDDSHDTSPSSRSADADALCHCVDCAAAFPRSALVMTDGELVCRACLRAGQKAAEQQRRLIAWLSISAVLLLTGLALFLFIFNRDPRRDSIATGGAGGTHSQSTAGDIVSKDGDIAPPPIDRGIAGTERQPERQPEPESLDDPGETATSPVIPPPAKDTLANHLNVSVIATSPGSPLIATYRRDASRRPAADEIRIWDLATGKPRRTLDQPHQADAMAISDDGRWLISMGRRGTQAEVKAWDLADGSVAASTNIAESFGSIAFAADQRFVWLLCPSDGFRRLDLQQRQFQRHLDLSPHAYLAQFSGPRNLAAVKCNRAAGGGAEQWIDVHDLASRTHLHKLNPGGLIGSFALAPDGGTIALGYRDRIDLYETRRWQKTARIDRAGVNAPQRLLFSPGSTHLVELPFGVDGASPIIRDLKAGTHVKINTKPCTDWNFGPGNRLHLASERSAVRVFELTGNEVK